MFRLFAFIIGMAAIPLTILFVIVAPLIFLFLQSILLTIFYAFGGIFSSVLLPGYVKLVLPKNDKEAAEYIKKTYLKIFKNENRKKFLFSLFMLTGTSLALYFLFYDIQYKNIGLGLLVIFMIISIFNVSSDIKKSYGFFNTKEKELFLKFVYEVNKQYPEYAKSIVKYLAKLRSNPTAKLDKYKIGGKNDVLINLPIEIAKSAVLKAKRKESKINVKCSDYIENGITPNSKNEQIEYLFFLLLKDYEKGIEELNKFFEQ